MDNRTNLDIENKQACELLGWVFGTALIIVSVGLIIGAMIWL